MKAYMLKTVGPGMTAHGGFVWPESGPVEAPDWNPAPVCGGGLRGLLWGQGGSEYLDWSSEARWLVVEIDTDEMVAVGDDKVKVPRGVVVHCGDQRSATDAIMALGAPGPVHGAIVTSGNGGTSISGDRGTAIAGDEGTAIAGYMGTAIAGYMGTAIAGYWGTSTSGYGGTSIAGYRGTSIAGYRGTSTSGDGGALVILHWDGKKSRRRCAEVDGVRIKPGVAYRLDDNGEFVEAQSGSTKES